MADTSPMVIVGIVTYNSVPDLPRCFPALRAQTYPHLRVILLDNASQDDSAAWVRANAPEVELLINETNVGYGRAHNQIIRHAAPAEDEFYLPLNPDVRMEAEYIALLVEAAQRMPDAGLLSGKLRLVDETGQPTGLIYSAGQGMRHDGYVINVGERMPDDGRFDEPREVMLVSGAAPLIRGAVIHAIAHQGDLFDPAMFMYSEDVDVGWRARRAGWRCLYVPAAQADHRGGRQSKAVRAQALANTFLTVIKNAYMVDLLTYNLPLMILSLATRLILTPARGWRVLRLLIMHAPSAWRQRRPAAVPRAEMLRWYAWSAAQPTGQETNLWGRLRAYLKR